MNSFEMNDNEQLNLAAVQQKFMTKVYKWMTVALLITAVVAKYTLNSATMMSYMTSSPMIYFGVCILELAIVFFLVGAVQKMSAMMASAIFIGFAMLNGLSMSVILSLYTQQSIAMTFMVCAGMFAAMSLYGYFTKKDLSGIGSFCFMLLVGLIIASIANMIFYSEFFHDVISYIGVFIFTGFAAYDTQKIKSMAGYHMEAGEEGVQKFAIAGALMLYLDFINLFIYLLRIFGRDD